MHCMGCRIDLKSFWKLPNFSLSKLVIIWGCDSFKFSLCAAADLWASWAWLSVQGQENQRAQRSQFPWDPAPLGGKVLGCEVFRNQSQCKYWAWESRRKLHWLWDLSGAPWIWVSGWLKSWKTPWKTPIWWVFNDPVGPEAEEMTLTKASEIIRCYFCISQFKRKENSHWRQGRFFMNENFRIWAVFFGCWQFALLSQ